MLVSTVRSYHDTYSPIRVDEYVVESEWEREALMPSFIRLDCLPARIHETARWIYTHAVLCTCHNLIDEVVPHVAYV